jgi:hypothetical protein
VGLWITGENHRPVVDYWRKPLTCCKSQTYFITYCCIEYTSQCCIEYTSQWAGFELTTLVVIDTYCIGSCKSNLPCDHDHDGPLHGTEKSCNVRDSCKIKFWWVPTKKIMSSTSVFFIILVQNGESQTQMVSPELT